MTTANPEPGELRARGRRRREVELAIGWVVVVALAVGLGAGGPWFLVIPLGAIGALAGANTVALAQRRGPEETTLSPGRLLRAGPDHDPVAVDATWAPERRARERRRQVGRLTWAAGRLSFVADATPSGADRRGPPMVLLDAEPHELRLGPAPTLWRPELVLLQGDTTHVLDLVPGWDIAEVGVGVLVAGEWYRQLREVGVRPS
ncbi:MAG: hypothetical protein MUE36_12510 [Acidimicrobiales bacterium]|jgi:hypothetical protein|nr:hypothetical protein [Acidimicrobiales bacterium]